MVVERKPLNLTHINLKHDHIYFYLHFFSRCTYFLLLCNLSYYVTCIHRQPLYHGPRLRQIVKW